MRLATLNSFYLIWLCEHFHVFFVVDTLKPEHEFYLSKATGIFETSRDCFHSSVEKQILELNEGWKLLQWHKFSIGLAEIDKYEVVNQTNFDYIVKLRTDLNFQSLQQFVNLLEECESASGDVVKMETDQYFSFSRKHLTTLAKFFTFTLTKQYERYEYRPLNTEHLSEMDFKAGKFHWLVWPKDVIGEPKDVKELYEKILDNKDTIAKIGRSAPFCLRADWLSVSYGSEPFFLEFIINQGLIPKAFNQVNNPGIHPLRFFDESIINLIQLLKSQPTDLALLEKLTYKLVQLRPSRKAASYMLAIFNERYFGFSREDVALCKAYKDTHTTLKNAFFNSKLME